MNNVRPESKQAQINRWKNSKLMGTLKIDISLNRSAEWFNNLQV